MIYLFTGSDAGKVREKTFLWIAAARKKAPEASYVRLLAERISEATLLEVVGAQGLFFSKTLTLLDDPFSVGESADIVLTHLTELADSPNPIAVLAPKLIAARVKKIEAKAEKVFTFDMREKKQDRGFNFALVNALASKNREALWKEVALALRAGDAPEMIHGILHYKAREFMKKGSAKWSTDGARELSRNLIELLSDSRSGDLPLAESLERFALSTR